MQSNVYTLPSGTLINKLGITDAKALEKFEAISTSARMLQFLAKPAPATFDLTYLKNIHQHVFQDVYAWAGKIRTVNLYKGAAAFADCRFIESYSQELFQKLSNQDYLKGLEKGQFCSSFAYYFSEVNSIHPFREGNGRTQRIFFTKLAENSNYTVDWTKITKDEMINASINSWKGDLSAFEAMFNKIIISI